MISEGLQARMDSAGAKFIKRICKSCTNYVLVDGFSPDQCVPYGKIPSAYARGESFDCPHYERKPDSEPWEIPAEVRARLGIADE